MLLSRRIIDALLMAVPKRDSRKVLKGINVRSDRDGTILESTEGRILMQVHVPVDKEDEGTIEVPPPDGIYGQEEWRVASRKMGNKKSARLDFCEETIALDGDEPIHKTNLKGPGQSVQLIPIDGKFPLVSSVMPNGKPKYRIAFNVNYLAAMAKAMEPFVEQKHHSVILEIWDDKSPTLWRTGNNINTDDAYTDEADVRVIGLLMPVRIHDIEQGE